MKLDTLLKDIFAQRALQYAVLSSAKNKEFKKVTVRPIQVAKGLKFQISQFRGQQAFHNNVDIKECEKLIRTYLEQDFKQALLCTSECDYHVMINRNGVASILKKPPTHSSVETQHNKPKQYLLDADSPIPFLVELGVMTAEGKIIAKKSDKFRQLNRFVELISDVTSYFDPSQTLHIVDFGCGKAYLTFALYHYLHNVKGYKVKIQGLDLKKDVVTFCQDVAKRLKYNGLQFLVGDIKDFAPQEEVDLMISLHACDIATDIAIAQAVKWKAKVIMCVPCCQKELYKQIENPILNPILKHGILKERFAALATDAIRAQLLQMAGYKTQVLEFIDLEHTPKNLLIRAIRQESSSADTKWEDEYRAFVEHLNVSPMLEKLLHP